MCSPSLLITCPYQFNLLSVIFWKPAPRMCSFLILSLRVTPHIHRSILISVTSIRFSCLFVVAHVSVPYSIAGLITVLYTFPFSFTGILLSHSSPLHFTAHCCSKTTQGGGRVLARDQSASLEDWQKLARTGEIVWFYNGRDRKKTEMTEGPAHEIVT